MRNNCGSIFCIIALLLTAFCCTTFSGCGDDDDDIVNNDASDDVSISIPLPSLVVSPDQYRGDKVEVLGQIVTVGSEDTSFLVLLMNGKSSIICEFPTINQAPPSQLEEEQWVTISGKVDILAGITLLRECEVKEDK